MQSVSAEFTAAAIATVRKPKARVTVTWTDPFRDLSISASATDVNLVDHTAQTYDMVESMSRKWFHLDGQTAFSVGSRLMPSSAANAVATGLQVGWFGVTRCDGSANFGLPYPALTIEFDERPITELLVVGDDKYNEYPVNFTVKIYLGVALLYTETVTGNTLVRYTKDISSSGIFEADKIVLTITKWSTASRVVKITEFFTAFTEIYDGDDILSLSLIEEMELTDGSLPIGNISANEMDIKFQNTDDKFNPFNTGSVLYTQMKRNRKIEPELGFELPDGTTEYVPLGVFWSGDWNTPEQESWASTSARDRMELLRKSIYSTSEIYENTTLYTFLETVLEDAKLQMPDLTYSIDARLADYTIPYAWLDRMSHMSAIRTIVEAAMGRAYCNRDGMLIILGCDDIGGTSALAITKDHYFSKVQPAKTEEVANTINVAVLPLIEGASKTIYETQESLTATTVQIKYSFAEKEKAAFTALAKAYEVVGGVRTATEFTVTAATYYAWGADLTVANGGAEYDVVITGTMLELSGEEIATAEDADSIAEMGVLKYEFPKNPLIQNRTLGQNIADTLLASYADWRRDVDVDWRGNPALGLADVVTLPTYGVATDDFYAVRQTIDFDGTLRAKLSGRRVTATTTAGA